MTDINFNKLNLEKNIDIIPIQKKGFTIEIKQYLPIQEKINVIGNIINYSIDDNDYANPMRIDIQKVIRFVEAYTNIVFSDNDMEDFLNLYDLLVGSGLWEEIYKNIPISEKDYIEKAVNDTINEYYKYRNSVLGILDTINTDYKDLNLDANAITKQLKDKENIEFLSEVMEKMG